jgi:eukaryotic-like serine/threonine-protein kinase
MNEAQWFDQLCELTQGEQQEKLAELERTNATLAQRVRKLLAADLEYANHTARSVTSAQQLGIRLPEAIGGFKVISELARGGMGVVYRAERQSGFQQTVAIKVLSHYAMDGNLKQRFTQERQLLAQLQHPNICQIIDGGQTSEGMPYLVMEFVEGLSLCKWCTQQRSDLPSRLQLFLQLCEAVQYAHQNLVVHRDLKDGNVIVNERGELKLLDFGIAKSLDAANQHTIAQEQFFSPLNASPEQIRGERATVSVDVYALGTLLHQLLTGELPFASKQAENLTLQRAVLEEVPPPISQIAGKKRDAEIPTKLLGGDLDAIVAKCLRKLPSERYTDVSGIARDIQAYLSGHPISASGSDRLYRFRKFVLRNKLNVGLGAIAAGTVVTALGVTLYQASQLREQRDLALAAKKQSETDRDRAVTVADFMRRTFGEADPGKASKSELLARDLIDSAKQQLVSLDGQPDVQAELALTLAESYGSMGLTQESAALLSTHQAKLESLASRDEQVRWRSGFQKMSNRITLDADASTLDQPLKQLEGIAATSLQAVQVLRLRERLHQRRSEFDKAAAVLEKALNEHGGLLSNNEKLRLRINLTGALISTRRLPEARKLSEALAAEDLTVYAPSLQVTALRAIAHEQKARGMPDADRRDIVLRWQSAAERHFGEDSLDTAIAYGYRAGVESDPKMMAMYVQKDYAIQQAKLPPVSVARAIAEYNMGYYYVQLRNQPQNGVAHFERAVDIGRTLYSRNHSNARTWELALAELLNSLGRHREVLAKLDNPPTDLKGVTQSARVAALLVELAIAAKSVKQPDKAQSYLDQALTLGKPPFPPLPKDLIAKAGRLQLHREARK